MCDASASNFPLPSADSLLSLPSMQQAEPEQVISPAAPQTFLWECHSGNGHPLRALRVCCLFQGPKIQADEGLNVSDMEPEKDKETVQREREKEATGGRGTGPQSRNWQRLHSPQGLALWPSKQQFLQEVHYAALLLRGREAGTAPALPRPCPSLFGTSHRASLKLQVAGETEQRGDGGDCGTDWSGMGTSWGPAQHRDAQGLRP